VTSVLTVLGGQALLVYLLFLRPGGVRPASAAWRWMVMAWGSLALTSLTTPIRIERLSLSGSTAVYVTLWILCFTYGDHLGYRYGQLPEGTPSDAQPVEEGMARLSNWLLLASGLGAIGFGHLMLSEVDSFEAAGVLAELRQIQLETDQGGLRTVYQVLAFAGLPASLVLVARSLRQDLPVPLHAWTGVLFSISIYFLSAGRQGIAISSIALIVTIVGQAGRRPTPYAHVRSIALPLLAVFGLFVGYFAYNVSTRSTGGGTMDDKLAMIERVYGIYVSESFRTSIAPLGSLGDTFTELYGYFGTQLPGLSASLEGYRGGHDLGLVLIPYVSRRLEWLTGLDVLGPASAAQQEVFANLGIPGNFFQSAVQSTFQSFGRWGALVFIFACGYLAGKTRRRLEHDPAASRVVLQAMICSGAAFTIVFSPTQENGWAFPVLWLLVMPALARRFYPAPRERTP